MESWDKRVSFTQLPFITIVQVCAVCVCSQQTAPVWKLAGSKVCTCSCWMNKLLRFTAQSVSRWMFLFPFLLCALVCIAVPCRQWKSSRAAAAKARLLWSIHVMLPWLCNSSLGWRRPHTHITQYALIHSLHFTFKAHIRHRYEINLSKQRKKMGKES